MLNYKAPTFTKISEDKFEAVFAKKSGHKDNGNNKSQGKGNIFGDDVGNNGKTKN